MLTVLLGPSGALADDGLEAIAGKALFERQWVPAPASTDAADGLGPHFNARGCAGCHKGGGGGLVKNAAGRRDLTGAVVRLGSSAGAADPLYGRQLQTGAVPGLAAEARVRFLPRLSVKLAGPALGSGINASVRLAPSLFGRAAFEDIAGEDILKHADPDDKDGDGISGRAQIVETAGGPRVARFGWKAAHATLDTQIAHAFMLDLGLSSPRFPMPHGDCTALQVDCQAAPTGESAAFEGREVSSQMISLVARYLATLEAPQQTSYDGAGAELFRATGCAACHVPVMLSATGAPIALFSDLLLHDMGPGLDDGAGEPGAGSAEWRTAPLIGLGLMARRRAYLHDGRAATLKAAILAHGGEAEKSKTAFRALTQSAKRRLIGYLSGL